MEVKGVILNKLLRSLNSEGLTFTIYLIFGKQWTIILKANINYNLFAKIMQS